MRDVFIEKLLLLHPPTVTCSLTSLGKMSRCHQFPKMNHDCFLRLTQHWPHNHRRNTATKFVLGVGEVEKRLTHENENNKPLTWVSLKDIQHND
ncbi:hypothetical protein CEXT_688101 [Caerostris extrusa]|uniref:Uncharacterized protein n=1 Tax=Caerostris extrusa TaxID=172846 RepID=A0AAV4QNF2_CAEEX|nr:hypothetical protein CEXT_688101 [Caerostris extrusa]